MRAAHTALRTTAILLATAALYCALWGPCADLNAGLVNTCWQVEKDTGPVLAPASGEPAPDPRIAKPFAQIK